MMLTEIRKGWTPEDAQCTWSGSHRGNETSLARARRGQTRQP